MPHVRRNPITVHREPCRARCSTGNLVGFVAADKVTAKFVGGAHNDEAACCRVYDKVSRIRNGTDQPRDKLDRLNVGVFIAIDLLDPPALPMRRLSQASRSTHLQMSAIRR